MNVEGVSIHMVDQCAKRYRHDSFEVHMYTPSPWLLHKKVMGFSAGDCDEPIDELTTSGDHFCRIIGGVAVVTVGLSERCSEFILI